MLRKIVRTAAILISVTTISAIAIVSTDKPEIAEAAIGFPQLRDWDSQKPTNQIYVEVGDCLRFGVTSVNQIPKANTSQGTYDNALYSSLGDKYHTANETSMVFYGYGGGTSDSPGTSPTYAGVADYIVSNQDAHTISQVKDGLYDKNENRQKWLERLQQSQSKMKVQKLYYAPGYISGSVQSAQATFNKLRDNLLSKYPTYTDLLMAFYREDDSVGLVRNDNFVADLVNNCGLTSEEAKLAMGYWLGNQCNLDVNRNGEKTGAELAFYNACTGNDWVNPTMTDLESNYKRMLSLISVYVVSMRAGSGDMNTGVINADYRDYGDAINELVDPQVAYITHAPLIESTFQVTYNPSGSYDTQYGIAPYEFRANINLEIAYRERKGGWTFAKSPSDNPSTITMTAAQQMAILSGNPVDYFCSISSGDTESIMKSVMGNGSGTQWAVENYAQGLTVGIWMQFDQGLTPPENLCIANGVPTTTYMLWGYMDNAHSGAHYGVPEVTMWHTGNGYKDLALVGAGSRIDGYMTYSDCFANCWEVEQADCSAFNINHNAHKPGPPPWAAVSWQGRDGLVDSAVDYDTEHDMTSLFTMYQYVYGFNMWQEHKDVYIHGAVQRPEVSAGGPCKHGFAQESGGHHVVGDYTGYAGWNNTSELNFSNTQAKTNQPVSNKAMYLTAIPNTGLFGFQCYVSGAVWQPTLVDTEIEYEITTIIKDSNPDGVTRPSGGNSWEYGYLDNDTFELENSITISWDASTPEKEKKVWLLRNNALILNKLNYFGPVSGIRLRTSVSVDDNSTYCGEYEDRYMSHAGHYNNSNSVEKATANNGAWILSSPTQPNSGITPQNESHTLNFNDKEGQEVRYLDDFWSIRDTINPDVKFVAKEQMTGDVFPEEDITSIYGMKMDMWYSGADNGVTDYHGRNQRNMGWKNLTTNNKGNSTVSVTRFTQYFKGDSGTGNITTTNELKDGKPNDEKYEAMAAVPTIDNKRKTETLFYSVGGAPYVMNIVYHTEYNKQLSGFNQCNYVVIDNVDTYMMDSAKVTNTGDMLELAQIDLRISNQVREDSKFNIDIKIEKAKAWQVGNNVRVKGDSVYALDKQGNWIPLFESYYEAQYDGQNLRNGYDSIRDLASEKILAIDNIHKSYASVWDKLTPVRNSKAPKDNPHNWTIGSGTLGELRGYNGIQNENKYNDRGAPIYVDGLKIKQHIENKLYGQYSSSVTYGIYSYQGTGEKLTKRGDYTSHPKYINTYPNGKTNEVIIHDPISVKYSVITANGNSESKGSDVMRSYTNSQNNVNNGGEPFDQRVGVRGSGDITDDNHLFIDYDFALKLDYTQAFGGNNAKYLDTPQDVLGSGFGAETLSTSPWIAYVYVKFPFDVSYDGEDYEANEWIVLEKPTKIGNNEYSLPLDTTTKTYNGFHIPLQQEELNDVTVDVKIQGVNTDNDDASKVTDTSPAYTSYNKERISDGGKAHWANRQSHKTQNKVDLVGHIGALTILDTGDFRFSNYFKKPTSGWLVDGLLKNVDPKKQNGIVADDKDVLRKATDFNLLNPYDSLSFIEDGIKTNELPLSTRILSDVLKKQPMKLGYSTYLSLETVGDYTGYQVDDSQIEIKPRYYYVTPDGKVTATDVFTTVDGKYVLVNEHSSGSTQNPNLYEYFYTLDWLNEKDRRMFTSSPNEIDATGDEEPSNEKTVHIGNLDYIFLRNSARTYFGNQTFYEDADAGDKQAQRWHFTLGLPSGAVFVPEGETPQGAHSIHGGESNILDGSDGGYVISTLEIVSKGKVWDLQYDEKDQTLPPYADVPTIPDGEIPDNEIPTIPYDPGKSASSDLSVQGSH